VMLELVLAGDESLSNLRTRERLSNQNLAC
jgi:hypothetical protein